MFGLNSFIFLVLLMSWASVEARETTNCQKFDSPLKGGYCVTLPEKVGNNDFIYHLHGAGGDEKTWSGDSFYPAQIRDYWRQEKILAPTIIDVSFGETWLLAPKNSSQLSGLLDTLTKEVIPKIEKSIGNLKGRRLVFGESMGGFNTIQLALKTQLFKKQRSYVRLWPLMALLFLRIRSSLK